ncbi:hypothetical protein FRC07_007283 [Ceratobasidium sp. 392]|nr:hypothetical protein FRC07_007283 [Ceratobasidium sp. 392]
MALGEEGEVPLASYVVGSIGPLVLGTEVTASLTDIFVPLTGRMGSLPPVESIIALLTTFSMFCAFPFVLPLAHRFGARSLRKFTLSVAAWSALTCVIFSTPLLSTFDVEHQKRLYALHMENVTSGEFSLQLGTSDAAPGFDTLVNEIVSEFGAAGTVPSVNVMNDWNPDWDVLYPFSQFVDSYRLSIPKPEGYASAWSGLFTVRAYDDKLDLDSYTRRLTLKISHPGLIWTVIPFNAWVLNWSLDSPPPKGYTRHHIREGSFYGTDEWTIGIKMSYLLQFLIAGQARCCAVHMVVRAPPYHKGWGSTNPRDPASCNSGQYKL